MIITPTIPSHSNDDKSKYSSVNDPCCRNMGEDKYKNVIYPSTYLCIIEAMYSSHPKIRMFQ